MTDQKPVALLVEDDEEWCKEAKGSMEEAGCQVLVNSSLHLEDIAAIIHDKEHPFRRLAVIVDPKQLIASPLLAYISMSAPDRVMGYLCGWKLDDEVHLLATGLKAYQVFDKHESAKRLAYWTLYSPVWKEKSDLRKDPLTGLDNRRGFDEKLYRELDTMKTRADSPPVLSIIAIDADRFKEINDQHGHGVGDKALELIAGIISTNLRLSEQYPCRQGGDEFRIALPGVQIDIAKNRGQQIQNALSKASIRGKDGEAVHPQISFGVACITRGEVRRAGGAEAAARKVLEEADVALYEAKKRLK